MISLDSTAYPRYTDVMTDRHILVLDDDDRLAASVASLLSREGWTTSIATNLDGVRACAIPNVGPDIVLSDWDFGIRDTRNGAEMIEALRERWGDAPRYIIWSGLRREVPGGVEFFTKDDLLGLLDAIQ